MSTGKPLKKWLNLQTLIAFIAGLLLTALVSALLPGAGVTGLQGSYVDPFYTVENYNQLITENEGVLIMLFGTLDNGTIIDKRTGKKSVDKMKLNMFNLTAPTSDLLLKNDINFYVFDVFAPQASSLMNKLSITQKPYVRIYQDDKLIAEISGADGHLFDSCVNALESVAGPLQK